MWDEGEQHLFDICRVPRIVLGSFQEGRVESWGCWITYVSAKCCDWNVSSGDLVGCRAQDLESVPPAVPKGARPVSGLCGCQKHCAG